MKPGSQLLRRGTAGCLLLLTLLTLCRCAAPTASDSAGAQSGALTPAAVTDRLREASGPIAWVSLSSDQLSNYFGFPGDLLRDFSVCVSDSDELSNEIAAFLPRSAEQRPRILEGINQHLNKTAETFRELNEDEFKKIQNRLMMELDGMIILAVTDPNAGAYAILKEMGAQEINDSAASGKAK